MCETDAGTWLLGSHEGRWVRKPELPVITRAYVLRSEDRGKTWTVLPDKRPGGWYLEEFERMDEPRPINLGGGKAMILARTCEGHLWEIRSGDDGRTWSEPKPTSLIHPDAPPMLFHHPDAKTLVAFHHNRHSGSHFKHTDRSEIWVSLSTDEGSTWSEPRFVFANALSATSNSPWHDHQCSYLDAFVDGDDFHLFVPHRWKRALYLTLNADDIERLPTKEDLKSAARVGKTLLFGAGEDGYAVFRIPGIVVTTKGTVLAYCVGRKTPGDWADIDIFLRRSTDGGKTWEPRKKLGDVGASTVDNPTAIVDRKTGAVHMLYQVDYARAFYMRSNDDGLTFSEPVEITPVFEEFRQEYDWNVIAPGPGHGIQLADGRLIVPVWLSTGGRRHRPSIVSVIYSDDHGGTWHRGDVVVRTDDEFVNPSETVAVKLTDGRVMLNIRNECPRHRRLVSFSADGATGWTKPAFDETLFEPICFGSIQRFSTKPEADRNRILFVNPNSGSRARRNLTVRLSYDEGRSWPIQKVLEPGIAGYSDLAVGTDGSVYCLYERGGLGGNHYHTRDVTVAKFSLQWLTDGRDVHLRRGSFHE
jgi:sialidase-1